MNLGQLRNLISVFVQAHDSKIDLSIELFNSLVNSASTLQFKRRIGLPERYQPGAPFPGEIAEITTKLSMDLRAFLVHRDPTGDGPVLFNDGVAVYPVDFCYPLSATYNYIHPDNNVYIRNFDMVSEMQWAAMAGSEVNKPDAFFPIMRFTRNKIVILPSDITTVNLVYYRWPREARLAMVVNNGINVYDNVNSVQLEWDEANTIDVAHIMLESLGVITNKELLLAAANRVKEQGI